MNFILFSAFCHIAFCDMTKRKIYNYAVAFLFVISLCFLYFGNDNWTSSGLIESLQAFLIYFLLFIPFYVMKWMGAGDVKLGAVLAFLFGIKNFFCIWVISLVFMLLYVGFERVMYHCGIENLRIKLTLNDRGKKYIPYGACLCIAAMVFILSNEVGVWHEK